jgi:flagellar hook-length control protein FliK
MNNLPISSNKPQPSGNTANVLQTNITADDPAMDVRPVEAFAFLLARQIGNDGLPAPDTAQTAVAVEGSLTDSGTVPSAMDAQGPAIDNVPSDPSNVLAAILLQLSTPEGKGQRTESTQATSPLALGSSSREAGYNTPTAGTIAKDIDPLSFEAINRAELPSGMVQPTSNTAQAVVSPTLPTAVPGTANSMPAGSAPAITTPLGGHGWADEFSQTIRWVATQQNQVAELHLNPPNLGPLDVVLKISDNQATALFTSPHGAVRDAVENALPKLREILADNGIMLGNTTVSDQSPRDRSMDEFMNQGFGAAVQPETSVAASEAGLSPSAAQTTAVRRHNGMVDTFA